MPTRARRWLAAAALALTAQVTPRAALVETVDVLELADSEQRVLIAHDGSLPVARLLVVFPGGDGRLGLGPLPQPIHPERGYVASLRRDAAGRGTAVVLVDAPAGRPLSLADRETAEYRGRLAALLQELQRRFSGAPVFLLGYSNGAVSALVAAREPGVVGVILVSGVFLRYADLAEFRAEVPLLVIHHEADRCIAPAFDESFRVRLRPSIVRAIAQPYAPSPCGPMSAHQLYGQEQAVTETVQGWMLTGRAASRIR